MHFFNNKYNLLYYVSVNSEILRIAAIIQDLINMATPVSLLLIQMKKEVSVWTNPISLSRKTFRKYFEVFHKCARYCSRFYQTDLFITILTHMHKNAHFQIFVCVHSCVYVCMCICCNVFVFLSDMNISFSNYFTFQVDSWLFEDIKFRNGWSTI